MSVIEVVSQKKRKAIKPFHSLWDRDGPCFFDAYVVHHTKLAAYIGLLAFLKDCHLPRSFQTTPLQWQVPWLQSCFSEFRKHRINWSTVYDEANSSSLFPLILPTLMNVFFGCIWQLTLIRQIFAYIYLQHQTSPCNQILKTKFQLVIHIM